VPRPRLNEIAAALHGGGDGSGWRGAAKAREFCAPHRRRRRRETWCGTSEGVLCSSPAAARAMPQRHGLKGRRPGLDLLPRNAILAWEWGRFHASRAGEAASAAGFGALASGRARQMLRAAGRDSEKFREAGEQRVRWNSLFPFFFYILQIRNIIKELLELL
jgi:hypothetical protein